ncbi:MAG: glycosyltransferase family 9 protein [bacterium]
MQTKINRRFPPLATLLKEFEVQFKWLVTWIIFFSFRRSWRNYGDRLTSHGPLRVLILRYDRIGDMVVSLPTFHVLKQRLPQAQIDVLASPANASIIESDSTINRVYQYRKDSALDVFRTFRTLARNRYDVIIDLVANVSATSYMMLLWVGREAYKIGVHKNNNVRLYDYIVSPHRLVEAPAVQLHFAGLEPFGIDLEACHDPIGLQLSPELIAWSDREIGALRDSKSVGLVGINISAGKPNREWGERKYGELVRQLSAHYPQLQFLLFCAPSDYEQATRIAAAAGDNVSLIQRGLSLLQVAALIRKLDCILSPDTSIVHIAASLNVPLVAMYTAAETNYRRWRPYTEKSWIVRPPEGDSLHGITVEAYMIQIGSALRSLFKAAPTGEGN